MICPSPLFLSRRIILSTRPYLWKFNSWYHSDEKLLEAVFMSQTTPKRRNIEESHAAEYHVHMTTPRCVYKRQGIALVFLRVHFSEQFYLHLCDEVHTFDSSPLCWCSGRNCIRRSHHRWRGHLLQDVPQTLRWWLSFAPLIQSGRCEYRVLYLTFWSLLNWGRCRLWILLVKQIRTLAMSTGMCKLFFFNSSRAV